MSPTLTFAFGGVTFFGILLLLSVLLKLTGGRFWSLPFAIMNPQLEAKIGEQLRVFILKYIPVPFVLFLLLFLYEMWRY
ncbi:hypothetical protein DOK78_000266 [Enterococcus sp. DIV2402]|uniref:Uncharacterized protein n=1 Tax=Candidatus Enterococcus lowellii TaxID=2230877 RepID=A0ABZ2SII2_9ENTE|nr:hypothetical protein [Enterococcus sp. DIV2402]MBO0464754.1 hypothetical protein [Enterococcus sp. DIV2402]